MRSCGITFSASWPGSSRPSTSFSLKSRKKDVDACDKRGHHGGEALHDADMPNSAPDLADFLAFVEAKFQTDERGRLLGSAPHFYLLRTPENVISRCHADLADDVVLRSRRLVTRNTCIRSHAFLRHHLRQPLVSAGRPATRIAVGGIRILSIAGNRSPGLSASETR